LRCVTEITQLSHLHWHRGVAETPRKDSESDAALRAATVEIQDLDADQMEAVIEYIASCSSAPSPERDYTCERAIAKLHIKTGRKLALQTVQRTIYGKDHLIQWTAPVGEQGAQCIKERAVIFKSLSDAASDRYYRLKMNRR
jgi:hypothetical protein